MMAAMVEAVKRNLRFWALGGTVAISLSFLRSKSVVVIAKSGNTNRVYLGGSDVASTTNGGLGAGESITLKAVGWLDLADVFLDAGVNGEGVDFYAVKA